MSLREPELDNFMTCAVNQVDPGGLGPDFIGGVKNVTVPEGRDVILSCTVVRLGTYKVQGVPKMLVYVFWDTIKLADN